MDSANSTITPDLPTVHQFMKENVLEKPVETISRLPDTDNSDTLLRGRQLAVLCFDSAFMVAFALVALDQTILSTALPTIASHFHAVSDISWIASAYVLPQITTMEQRPILMGTFGAVFAISSIVGPLLGGVLSDHVSWRWCFYINLPLGAVAILATVAWLPNQPTVDNSEAPFRRWLHLDWIGAFLSFAMVTMLLIALQWGGNERPWSDTGVITTFVLFAVLLLAFVAWERKMGAGAILPLQFFLNPTVLGACLESPLFFQIRGHSATQSGIDILPFMLAGVFAVFAAGGIITVSGRPWPFLFFFPLIASVASGLLFTMTEDTSAAQNVGFQILLGVGLGAAIQNSIVVAQAEFTDKEEHVPIVTSLMTFMQLISSSIGLAVSGAVFASQLKAQIRNLGNDLPDDVVQAVLSSVKAIFGLPPEEKALATKAYIVAVRHVFLVGVPAAVLASISALLVTHRKITISGRGADL
ncbi:Efflux pump roqT [Hypsizygus marmoreus]|uniref:Efflux pump roqT n=1 Tax=Hypsizygus marmoreus TaxID=39966 RepID=A0A369JVG7_HYPMA|nr:Efflux pump roqT [Hypsizygus marmoreus]